MSDIIKKVINHYTHHEVSPQTRDKVLRRLATTQDDNAATEAYRQLWDEIEVGKDIERKPLPAIVRWWPRIAAVIVPLLIAVGLVQLYVIQNNKQTQNIPLLHTHTTMGEHKSLVLPDGTKVEMKGGTVVQYPASFHGHERKVYLVGEAFFDVRHDASKPFRVVTPYFDITDIGTSFNVSSYTTTDEVSLYVKTGIVDLRPELSDSTYRLTQDEYLSYNVKSGKISVVKGLPPMWKTSQINLDNMTLAEAMDKLSQVYGVNISMQSKKHYDQRITVHFNRGETLEVVLDVISNVFPGFKYRIEGNKIVVY